MYSPAVAGSSTGLPNRTEYCTASGSRASMFANTAAALNIPCAMTVGNPNNFAAIVRYLDRLPEQEFAVVCVVDATARNRDLMVTSAYQSWAAAHGDLLSGH